MERTRWDEITWLFERAPEHPPDERRSFLRAVCAGDTSLRELLYKLLTGRRPFQFEGRTPGEVERAICEEAPMRPSTAVTARNTRDEGDASPEAIGRGDLAAALLFSTQAHRQLYQLAQADALIQEAFAIRKQLSGDAHPKTAIYMTERAAVAEQQGEPAHIGSPTSGQGYEDGDPYGAFLPPPLETNEEDEHTPMRAVVFVTEETRKGTARSPQEYADPLLVLTGAEYAALSFDDLYRRLCDALRGDRPRLTMQVHTPDGRVKLMFEDGTSRTLDAERR